jgi:hypothetical protein
MSFLAMRRLSMRGVCWGLLGWTGLSHPAAAGSASTPNEPGEDERQREADIFGTPEDTPAAGEGTATPSPPPLEVTKEDELDADRFWEQWGEDTLSIGGRFYLALSSTIREEGPPVAQALFSPSLVDVYVDTRPSDQVRGFLSSRLDYDVTALGLTADSPSVFGKTPFRLSLDQLWLKFDLAQTVFITVGKQRIRWGTGRFWNPTDFLNPARLNPLDVFDRRLGVGLVKFHVPIESWGWNLYGFGILDETQTVADVGIAGRIEAVVRDAELSFSARARRDEPLRLGASVSAALSVFDVQAELALQYGAPAPRFSGDLPFVGGDVPEPTVGPDTWQVQAVVGGEFSYVYSPEGTVTFGAEYFFQEAGIEDPRLYPVLLLQGGFSPLYLGQHYVAAYLVLPAPGSYENLQFLCSTLGNLSDFSWLTRIDTSIQFLTFLTINLWTVVHYGNEGEFRFRLELPPIDREGFTEGITLAAPILDVGAALTLRF